MTKEMEKYTEIFKLRGMLEVAEIPFQFREMKEQEGFQIGYPVLNKEERVCSVVEHSFSYGAKCDRLEIMGLLTESEIEYDGCGEASVAGYLTAEDVFGRINKHYILSKN